MAPTGKKNVSVDVDQFIRTRDALSSAYMSLSSSIDKAVKAYIDHTNVVLAGDGSLNVSYLTQPFDHLSNTAQLAQQALHATPLAPQANGAAALSQPIPVAEADVKKKKRRYKQRDPNAPKRPLTAYFRYLQEQRAPIAAELAAAAGGTPQKPGDLSKEATERWNKLSKEEQQPYRDAYQRALKDYEKEVTKYKAAGGDLDEQAVKVSAEVAAGAAAEEDVAHEEATSDDDEESSSSEEDSDESEEDEPAPPPPPPPPPKATSPETGKKTKGSKKKSKPSSESAPPVQFSSLGSNTATATPLPPSSSERKRKATATPSADAATESEQPKKKKGGRKAAATDSTDSAPVPTAPAEELPKKKKKKKADA